MTHGEGTDVTVLVNTAFNDEPIAYPPEQASWVTYSGACRCTLLGGLPPK